MVEPSNKVYWRLPGKRLAPKLAEHDRPRVAILTTSALLGRFQISLRLLRPETRTCAVPPGAAVGAAPMRPSKWMVLENMNAVWVMSADALPSVFSTPFPSPLIGMLVAVIGCWQSTLPAKWTWKLASGACARASVKNMA